MRIYEFSKKHHIPTKEILQLLHDAGFEAKGHMSALNQGAIDFLLQHIEKKAIHEERDARPLSPTEGLADVAGGRPSVPIDRKELVVEAMSLADFAQRVGRPVNELIVMLLKMGVVATKNQTLPEGVVVRLAEHLEIAAARPKIEKALPPKEIEVEEGVFKARPPVVVVLGHVDHGKTTLLDFIRKTRVAAREKGGITQHLGAYEVKTRQGDIVFLDTPGHEAFYKMRGRGAGAADIAILIVAADDGVMPQTIEAIKHAKAAGIPIIVAINKVDKVDATRIDAIKQSLVQYDLLPEEFGGEVVIVPISAKFGQGVDNLLEMVVLQSQLMELTAEVSGAAKGHVLEAKPERGRGSVGTILCQHGRLRIGDYFVCGQTGGKVSSLIDSTGKRVVEVGPCTPVQVAGFSALPEVGDFFEVVSQGEYRKLKARVVGLGAARHSLIEGALSLVIKVDTSSSREALLGAISRLGQKLEKKFNVIYAGIGDVSESDIMLALNTGSLIFVFHVKIEQNAILLAQRHGVSIESFDIIYKLLEALEGLVEKGKEVKKVLTKIGEAIVRKVFDIKGIGVIAGCYVREGRIVRNGTLVVWRGKQKIGEGPISSLQRERRVVKEVHAGFECGFLIKGFADWAVDDKVECFLELPEGKKKKAE